MDLKTKVAAILKKEVRIAGVFDRNFYNSVNPDISKNNIDPIKHYFQHGSVEGRQPNALFDPIYYREKYLDGKQDVDPLLHYIGKNGKKNSPHPLFDVAYYIGQLTEEEHQQITTSYLEHFISDGWKRGYSPTPFFDMDFYLSENKDVEREQVNPLIHYLTFGENEGRAPSPVFEPNLYKKPPRPEHWNYAAYQAKSKLEFYALGLLKTDYDYSDFVQGLDQLQRDRPVVVFVSHDGTRTGAPLIVLEIAKRFKANYNIQPVNILLAGGVITPDFDELGPTYVSRSTRFDADKLQKEMQTVVGKLHQQRVVAVIVNSAESRNILPTFDELDVPVISLVHEFAHFYPENSWEIINEHSDIVIFPSNVVKKEAIEYTDFDEHKLVVRGQGLLNERFLQVDRQEARSLMQEQIEEMKEDSIVVLGCGTADPRKGIDYFVNIGMTYFANKTDEQDVIFVWLGKLVENQHLNWSLKDVERAGLTDRILFVGPTADPAPFFVGSDVFLMTSRADPFPCVVHEAMAAHLPIICYEGGGGFVEALAEEAGIVLPYADFYRTTQELNRLVQEEEYRYRIGENAKKRLLKHYDFRDYSSYLAQLIIKSTNANNRNLLWETAPELKLSGTSGKDNHSRKVIFTLPSWEAVSGVNTFVEHLITELRAHGYDAHILFTYEKAKTLTEQDESLLPKVPYRFLNTQKDDSGYECESIWQNLKVYLELNAPCVFVPNYDYISSAISADLSNEVGILGALHSDDIEHYEHAYRLGRYWNHTVAVSRLIHDKLMELNPAIEKRSSVIPYGIKPPVTTLREVEKSSTFSIVYTGRIAQYQKRILDFVEVIKAFEVRFPDFIFTFVGDGPEMEQLTTALEVYEEAGKVRFLGRQNKEVVFEELAKSHAFVLFSDFEGLPLSLLEALAMGCVPVLTDIESGVREVITDGENGLISPIGNISAFVDNLVKLAEDEELQQKLSEKAFATLNEFGLTTETMGEKYKAVINDIFAEIENDKYQRPPALTFGSSYGNVLMAPMNQTVRRNIG